MSCRRPRFASLVERTYDSVRDAALADPLLWPYDGGEALQSAPERLVELHRRRVEALRSLATRELEKESGEPIRVAEFLLQPSEGQPWISLTNVSSDEVSLSRYRLAESFATTGGSLASVGTLRPGATVRVSLESASRRVAGGWFVLTRGGLRRTDRRGFRRVRSADVGHLLPSRVLAARRVEPRVGMARRRPATRCRPRHPTRSTSTVSNRAGAATSPSGFVRSGRAARRILSAASPFCTERPRRPPQTSTASRCVGESDAYRYAVRLRHDERRPRTDYYFEVTSATEIRRAFPLGAPAITLALPVPPSLQINEVLPRPARGSDQREYIEIHNAGDRPVSLQGYYLSDNRRVSTKWRVAHDVVIPPDGYYVFYADGLDSGDHVSFRLSNSGEFIGLYGPASEGNLRIDSLAFRGLPPGVSWGRRQDGTKGFRVWKDPTPGRRNLPKIPDEFRRKDRPDTDP